jgi:spermidine/putrescine transport system permease protein
MSPERAVSRRRWGLAVPPLGYLLVFFFVPLAIMVVLSFWRLQDFRLIPAFTFDNYYDTLMAPLDRMILVRTVELSILVVAISIGIGYPAAYFLARRVPRWREVLVVLAILPLWTSYLIRTFAWIPMLSRNGVVNQSLMALGIVDRPVDWLLYSPFAVVVGLVGVYLPYMILPCYAVLERLDERLLEAARDLGARPLAVFWHIILPLSAPGLAVGSLFVFVLAMGSYVTPALLGGTRGILIGNQIGAQFLDLGNFPRGSAMALVLMGLIVVLAAWALRRSTPGELYGR